MGCDREILRIAVPSMVSNIIVPVLGMVDLAIAGHIGDACLIGAISVGATMLSLTYWNFGFLRMGTAGLTAQAYGGNKSIEISATLWRSLILALSIAAVILLCRLPLQWLLEEAIGGDARVRALSRSYYFVCIWGAPATLATMSLSGWFVGMQNTVIPMIIAISINCINIAVSALAVFVCDSGWVGIAVGTLAAQWSGLLLAVGCVLFVIRRHNLPLFPGFSAIKSGFSRFFTINRDIFLRSLCLMSVTLYFTAVGARLGGNVLAVNAIMMQLFLFYSYFLDGYAFAGEALVGRYRGSGNRRHEMMIVKRLFVHGVIVALVFTTVYCAFPGEIARLFTDDRAVVVGFVDYHLWIGAIPLVGLSAFLLDGVFVGLTATAKMLKSMAFAALTFFAVLFSLDKAIDANHCLWLAFTSYLFVRGMSLAVDLWRLYHPII